MSKDCIKNMKPLYNLNQDQESRTDKKFDTDSVPERLLEKANLPSIQRVKHAYHMTSRLGVK